MKKLFAMCLALAMLLPLCACGGTQVQEDDISMNDLYLDLENIARAQQNIGKRTTVYGQVTDIATNGCTVVLFTPISSKNGLVFVELPADILAELNCGQFVVISAIVTDVSKTLITPYFLKADALGDISTMDAFIRDSITACLEANDDTAFVAYEKVTNTFRISLLEDYFNTYGDTFLISDDTELKNYLVGEGEWAWLMSDLYRFSCEFREDGTYLWRSDREQIGDWNVSQGKLESFATHAYYNAYVISDRVFFWNGYLFVKGN